MVAVAVAVAVFKTSEIVGEAVASSEGRGTRLRVNISKIPAGLHGFHIHNAGDLRGEGCLGACSHFHKGTPSDHGGAPGSERAEPRHIGDLGNITVGRYSYFLADVKPSELWGRSLIIHADEDDLGLGSFDDSKTTGHSGARIGCAIFGRAKPCSKKTRKVSKRQ
jgi:Cu-Zn family superoxide dismutase